MGVAHNGINGCHNVSSTKWSIKPESGHGEQGGRSMTKSKIADARGSSPDLPVRASASNGFSLLPAWIVVSEINSRRWFLVIAGLIFVVGAALRIVGLFGDFWLDEIWSWAFAMSIKSVKGIFFGIHHDNNHYLNTLWLYILGDQPNLFVYRMHSYVAGVATIVGSGLLAGDLAFSLWPEKWTSGRAEEFVKSSGAAAGESSDRGRFARASALVTMLLVATCEFACVYSTEARGYSLSGAAAVFSALVLRRVVAESSSTSVPYSLALTYAILSIVGFLSHLSFATVFLPLAIWSTLSLFRRRCFLPIVICHLPAVVVVAVLWTYDLRLARVGGAPTTKIWEVGLESLALPTGAAYPEWLVMSCAGIVLVGLLRGLFLVIRRSPVEGLLFGLLLLIAPPLMYGLRSDGLLSSRHFYVVWMSLFPLLGLSLAQIGTWSRGRWPTLITLFAVWFATNGWEFSQFAVYGRGGYAKSVDWLVAEVERNPSSTSKPQTIGSDHDFRNATVLSFYLRRIHRENLFEFVAQGQWPAEGLNWLLAHGIQHQNAPNQEVVVRGIHYDLKHYERYSAPIGWHWAIYRRRDSGFD